MYEQMKTMMENINGGLSAVTIDDGGVVHFVYANKQYYSLLGYTTEQFNSELENPFDVVHPDDVEYIKKAIADAMQSRSAASFEYRCFRRDGSIIYLRCNASVASMKDVGDTVLLSILTDITAQRLAEQKEQRIAAQLRIIMENIDAGVSAVTLDKGEVHYIYANDHYYSMFGYTKEQFLQEKPSAAFEIVHPQDRKTVSDTAINALRTGQPFQLEYRALKRDGTWIWIRCLGSCCRIEDFEEPVQLAVTRDITKEKEAENSFNKMQRELMDDTPGGFVRIQLPPDGVSVPVYVNEGFCKLVGMTREEVFSGYGSDAMWGVHPDDIGVVKAAQSEMITLGETRGTKFRLRHGGGGYIWVMIFGRMTRSVAGEVFFNVYYTDATFTEQEKKELAFRETLPVALRAMMAESNELSYVKDNELAYICCSNKYAQMAGLDDAEDIAGKTDYDLFNWEVADRYRHDDLAVIKSEQSVVDRVESVVSEDGVARYCAISKYLLRGATGNILGIYGVGRDITENREASSRLNLLAKSIPGGIATYITTPDGLRITYFNDGFCRIMGYTREEYEKLSKHSVTSLVFKEDLPALMEQIEAIQREDKPLDCTFRIHNRHKGYRWVNLKGSVAERNTAATIFNGVMFDVTDEKAALDAARIHEEEMQAAMSHMGKMVCEYDPAKRTLTLPPASALRYDVPPTLYDFPESLLSRDVIVEDYAETFTALFEAIRRGDKTGAAEYRERWADGSVHWARGEFSTIFDADGAPVKAIVAVEDITQQYTRFELEQSRPALGEENLIVHALFNLTTGETLEYAYRDGSEVPVEDRTAFGYGDEKLDALFINASERAQYREINDRMRLLTYFEKGETELSIDYRRLLPTGDIVWVRNLLHMVKQPGTDDVLLFEYFYNIEEEKTLELVSRSLVSVSYDYVARVNARTGRFAVISNTGVQYGMPPKSGEDFDKAVIDIAGKFIHPLDRQTVIDNACIGGIKANLERQERFQFTCRLIRPDGEVRYKKFTEYYLDIEREILLVLREDVSELVESEIRKNEQLSDALAAAKQASQAKSQFLSRMSHELRTPMNAIIGLSALSQSESEDAKLMADSIGKIGMSARYLLSLINDILEMSRIESGRMTLNEAPFDFEEFIAQVNTIILAQTQAKGVEYDAVVSSYTEPAYIADATKLQEILVNVLGNAVKFTPRGGKVTLKIEQIRVSNHKATLRFTVSDTGVGIDEAFMPYIFDPFAQEASGYTTASTGTGLGLAISKNLVDMMNGQINIKSIKNVGSVFTIDVQLGISEESQRFVDAMAMMNLDKMLALVVDDDVTVCESTQGILKMMGIEASLATSGRQAVDMVKSRREEGLDYDTIFIDWKMPEMDGIETARRIRKVVGDDATIIIITAYDWRPIEKDAMEAGVNMFMEKPLFHSSIVKVLQKLFRQNAKPRETPAANDFDFTNKRILLVEDHPLNVEVAKRLLEKAGASVVVANNGLEAIEWFTTQDDGWFSAILMDIRMPVMDGLTAAKSIRSLRKKGSRDIPIIAMTANAFDEDEELSLSCGMNAHLAKPIEPQVLFSTLKRLIKG